MTTFSESYIAKADIGSYIETVETTFKQTADGLQTDIDMQKAIISKDGNVVRVGTEGFIDIASNLIKYDKIKPDITIL